MERFSTKRSEALGVLIAIPESELLVITNQLNRIESLLSGGTKNPGAKSADEYLTEPQVKEEYDMGVTWLWDKRSKGLLPYSKVGGKIYYRRGDIIDFLNRNNSKPNRKK